MADTRTDPEVVEETELEEPDATHIVLADQLALARLTGEPVEALCGKIWVPRRNPDDFPLCQACQDIMSFRDQVGW
jgi:hypothetical protein